MKISLPVVVIVLGIVTVGVTSFLSNTLIQLKKSNDALYKSLSVQCPKPAHVPALDDYVKIHRNVTM